MHKNAIKELMYGGIRELMNNSRFYYHSSVGRAYSNFTEDGKRAVNEFILEMTAYIHDAETADLDNRAKEMVLEELKRT